jgi:ACS family tartrate transporter-like MFS transporter
VEHWSARKWFARILLTWGLCSMGIALVRQPWQFYTMRFLLGLAEAGFFPGVIVYFTHWFPRAERGRALSGLVLGVPVSLALGARVSGYLLEVNWFGLAGWQWLFLVEGLPAVVLGVVVLFVLTDRPRAAKQAGGVSLAAALRKPTVWLLALGILAANTGGYALLFWLPTAVKGLLVSLGRGATDAAVLNWLSLVYGCGVLGVVVSGQSSDRTGERKWHCAAGMAGAGVFLAASVVPNAPWVWVFACLCLTGFFCYFWPSPFWVLPTMALSSSEAAVAVGMINICANVAGLIGNPVVGQLKSHGVGNEICLFLLALCYVAGACVIALLRVPAAGGSTGDGYCKSH